MTTPFDINKAAQSAYFFLSHAGGELEILKLVKLLYLADRESLKQRRTVIIGGTYYSLKHGPITSEALDLIDDGTRTGDSPWELLISDRANNRVGIRAELKNYDALAESELRVLTEVWDTFGGKGKWELVDWTHAHCEEWSNPGTGRIKISARKLAESFNWKESEIDDFEAELETRNRLHGLINH